MSSFILPPEEGKQEEEELLPDKAGWDASAIELLSDIAESTSEKENEPGKRCDQVLKSTKRTYCPSVAHN